MSFLHPLALLGLAAAAIPALLHLLQRRVPPEIEFPPIRYLTEAERQSARRLKLRHLLLLILRTAVIVVVVLAAARPLVRAPVAGAASGAHEPTALAVILDNSLSSGAVVGAGGRAALERLRAAARDAVRRSTAADRVWLLLADGIVRSGSREALLATIDSAAATWHRLDLVSAVERAARLVDAEPLANREVHVLSDLQATALADGRAAVPRGVRVVVAAPPPIEPPPNWGIADARVADGAAAVRIAGSGTSAPATVSMRVARRGWAGTEVRALAAPGAAVSMPLPPGTATPGWWIAEVTLPPDELRADDRRLAVWQVAEPATVVEAGPGAAGPFLATALAVLREAGRVSPRPAGRRGDGVVIGDAPPRGAAPAIVLPPADPALVGQANRALAARNAGWRWNPARGTPGRVEGLDLVAGTPVMRRYRMERAGEPGPAGSSGDSVLATVNGEPWLVRSGSIVLIGSRLDTAWTALPGSPGFVPFVDALVNRIVSGKAEIASALGSPRVDFRVAGVDTLGATVYGPDPRESDLTQAAPRAVAGALGGDAVEIVEASQFGAALFTGTRRADISGLLLLMALALVLVELGVATLTR